VSLPILVFAGLGVLLSIVAERRERGLCLRGFKAGVCQMIGILPMIGMALLLAGMVEALIPDEFVRQWLSSEAGFRGVGLGVLGGILLAMGPYAAYPIIASVYAAGAGLGTVISLLAAWALLNLSKFPFEVGFLGLDFALRRMAIGIPYCLLVGSVAHIVETYLLR